MRESKEIEKEPKTDQLDEIRVFPQKTYVVGQRIHPETEATKDEID